MDSLSSPTTLNIPIPNLNDDYMDTFPTGRSPSPPTSPARPSASPLHNEENSDEDMYTSGDEENTSPLVSPGSPLGPSPGDSSSDESPDSPSPRPAPRLPNRRRDHSTPTTYRLLRDSNGKLATVEGQDSKSIWGGLDGTSGDFWHTYVGPHVFITPITQASSLDIDDAREKIKKTIEYHTGATNIVVAIPTYSGGPVRPFVVSHISDEIALTLTNQRVWATAAIAFAAWPSSNFPSHYVLTLLHLDIPVDDVASAKEVIVSALEADTFYKSFVIANRDAYPNHWSENRCLRRSLNSIRCEGHLLGVRGTEKKTVAFNVYFHPPTNNPSPLHKLYQYLRTRKYPTVWGTAIARPPYACSTCLGTDHPTGLCPYPQLPGWPLSAEALQVALGTPPPLSRQPRNGYSRAANSGTSSRGQRVEGRNDRRNPQTRRGRGGRTAGRGRM